MFLVYLHKKNDPMKMIAEEHKAAMEVAMRPRDPGFYKQIHGS